ncbi:MAG TPA: DNA primase, partial [Ruminococcaceae bacterium]|nr:DNA primase [Oscillospiraceae bacterium]
PARFRQLLEASGNDVEYRLQKIRSQCDMKTPDGKITYLSGAADVLATLENRVEQEVYAGRLAEETGVDRSAILLQADKKSRKRMQIKNKKEFRAFAQQTAGYRDTVNPEKKDHLRAANAEEGLIVYLFQHPDAAGRVSAALPAEKFITAFNRRVYQVILGKIKNGKACSLTDLSEGFSVDEIAAVAKMLAQYHQVAVTAQDAGEYIDVILQENGKMKVQSAGSAQPQDIREYLERLKEQKK